jgi:radical SAM protein with 4Fe4S-binding SPASM domain
MKRHKGYMSEGLFKKIVDEVAGKTEFIYLHGMGEALLHPKFFEFARYVSGKGMKTSVSTNTTLLNEKNSLGLLENIDFLTLPIDGVDKEVYEKIRKGANFDKNLKNVKRVLMLKRDTGSDCYIDIQFVMQDTNKAKGINLWKLFTKEEISVINSNRIKPVYVSPEDNAEKIIHRHPCYFLWSIMIVQWDGTVNLCCMDYEGDIKLGDANKSSIYDIWNGEEITSLREYHKKLMYDKMPFCDNCSVAEKNYFSAFTILGSAFLHAGRMRKLLSFFERMFVKK